MASTTAEKRAAFRALHETECFLLPNPWDVGSARMMQHLGFAALASTSAGYAWTMGKPDYAVTLDAVLDHLAAMSAAVDLPINADFEAGFAADAEGVAANVAMAVKTGIAGLSIEDRDLASNALYDKATAIERVKAARAAIDETGEDVILVARTEGLLMDSSAIIPAIDKLVAFAEAGADCLYAPGVWKKDDIAEMVRAVAPKPLNVLVRGADYSFAELAELGVRRISIGGLLATVAWGAVLDATEQMKAGSFAGLVKGAPGKQLNAMFAPFARD